MKKIIGQKLRVDLSQGNPIATNHLVNEDINVNEDAIRKSRIFKISLPVRLSDYEAISAELPINSYEFHLSYKEVESNLEEFHLNSNHRYSVHLPDYIDSINLIDPFSKDHEIRQKSLICIKRVVNFSERIAQLTGQSVPIVASLAGINMKRDSFYPAVEELFSENSTLNALLTLQWLPPFAWYFGGSIKLNIMNSLEDVPRIIKYKLPITLDTSHLLLGKNAYGLNPWEVVESLKENIVHWHISDSLGLDGEGMPIGHGGKENERFIGDVIRKEGMKVIEVWQGHFNNYHGFKAEINKISSMEKIL
jgi:N-acetylneuraminate synthase